MYSACCLVFFFKQKTAYEMRISDWISDVCSSDLYSSIRRSPLQKKYSMGWRARQHRRTQAPEADFRRAVFPANRVSLGRLPLPLRRGCHRQQRRSVELVAECLRQLNVKTHDEPSRTPSPNFCSLLCAPHMLVPISRAT